MRGAAILGLAGLALLTAGCEVQNTTTTTAAAPAQSPVERGKYLVTIGGCSDCHTPGTLLGMPDMARFLGGSEVGFELPGLGTFHAPNLTPDPETGLGTWTEAQIVTAITTGKRPDGRELAPIMPWRGLAALTPDDAMAIAIFLKSLPPVANKVPGPFGPNQTATSFVMRVIPPPGAGAPPAP
jgi:mono/diheme cytochrome c family protein